jgi:hypothetical protein
MDIQNLSFAIPEATSSISPSESPSESRDNGNVGMRHWIGLAIGGSSLRNGESTNRLKRNRVKEG